MLVPPPSIGRLLAWLRTIVGDDTERTSLVPSLLQATSQLAARLSRVLLRATMLGMSKGPHVTRYQMYRRLSEVIGSPAAGTSTLSISHSLQLCEHLGLTSNNVVEANYPHTNMLSLPFRNGEFDYVVGDQVLEHVEGNPYQAMEECFRVLKPRGLAIHTTCLVNPIHGAPKDFWRFTPGALELLCSSSAQIIDVGGWGNPVALVTFGLGWRFEPVPHCRIHPYHWIATADMKSFPISTWIVAQKL